MTALGIQRESAGDFASPKGSLTDDDRRFIADKLQAGVGLQNISQMVGRPVKTIMSCQPRELVEETIRLRDELEALRSGSSEDSAPLEGEDLRHPDVLNRWRKAFDARPAELKVLARLVAGRGCSVSREDLMDATGSDREPEVVNVYICHIRKALAKAGIAGELKNDWGTGYRLTEAACQQVMARVSS